MFYVCTSCQLTENYLEDFAKNYTPTCELKESRNINVVHRPEEALDIQSDWMFVNGMVHLPQEWSFGTPTSYPSPATLPSPLTPHPSQLCQKAFSRLHDVTCSICLHIKSFLCVLTTPLCFRLIIHTGMHKFHIAWNSYIIIACMPHPLYTWTLRRESWDGRRVFGRTKQWLDPSGNFSNKKHCQWTHEEEIISHCHFCYPYTKSLPRTVIGCTIQSILACVTFLQQGKGVGSN